MEKQLLRKGIGGWRTRSIQTRLTLTMALMLVVMLVVNLFIYGQINSMVRRIDAVFASNVTIGEITDTLEEVRSNVFEYLSTKSSSALEDYYRYAARYADLVEQLDDRMAPESVQILEKNIRGMSKTFLSVADETVQAKRGRNVERYKFLYERGQQLCRYINNYIYQLNSLQFSTNSAQYEMLLRTMGFMEILSFSLLAAAFAVSLLAAFAVIRAMIRPLSDLSEAAERVAAGDFDVEVPEAESQDEIGIVSRSFSQMLRSIRAYIERLRTSMEKEAQMKERELSMEAHLKEAQLKFLQAQINPHFLFNSLNAGAQLAVMEDADATGVFLEKMADFFRYNVRKLDGTSTLGEEIALVDNYIYILNVRFAGDITYVKEIGEGLSDVVMPGMIIQPLVENAVLHGIHDMMDRGVITLSAERDGDAVRVVIADNGEGMTPAQLRSFAEGTLQGKGAAGIGLRNVTSRMELFYDRTDLVSVYSAGKGQGTEVTLLLPLPDEQEDREEAAELQALPPEQEQEVQEVQEVQEDS